MKVLLKPEPAEELLWKVTDLPDDDLPWRRYQMASGFVKGNVQFADEDEILVGMMNRKILGFLE